MTKLSIQELCAAYQLGELQPQQLLEQVYANVEIAGQRPVWITLNPFDAALAALKAAAEKVPRGPLFGVPFAVKDNIDVAGLPTTAGCPEYAYIPATNAFVVERLIQAGAIVIGKTNLDQFATGLVGTRSPYGACSSIFDRRYISGGSSSGSAVAVARGDVCFALGTDTAGSGRVPAAFNGIIGLKPTRGLLSTSGVVPACRSLDCVSIFALNLADAERVFDVCIGYDDKDPFSRKAASYTTRACSWRLGVPNIGDLEFFGDSESEQLYQQAVARLVASGWQTVNFDLKPFRQVAELLYAGPWVVERLAALGRFIEQHPQAIHPVVRDIIEGGRRYSACDVFEASYELARLRRAIEPVWKSIDAIVLPTTPTQYTLAAVLADPVTLNQNLGIYTNFANLLDLCALAVPAGVKSSGLPFGITWLAPAWRDQQLLEFARNDNQSKPRASNGPSDGSVWLAVAGAHLSGQPLNSQLLSQGARFIASATTAAEYRLYALNTVPPKPGLVYTPNSAGQSIEVELWELEERAFGSFVSEVPAPMTIGTTKLADGSRVKGFCCEPHALADALDITQFGGWRAYLAAMNPV